MLTITTGRIADVKKLAALGYIVLDITVKSGDKVFAPSWDIVMGYKNSTMTWEVYEEKYREMMRVSFRENREHWLEVLRGAEGKTLALVCYCATDTNCHRRLLKGYMLAVAKKVGLEAQELSESGGPGAITSFKNTFLSNFHPCSVKLDGEVYPSVEHAFQAAKTTDLEKRVFFTTAITAAEAKQAGKRVALRPDWDQVKESVMQALLEQKFSQEPLRSQLLATGGKELIEGNVWHDNFWGVCQCADCKKLVKGRWGNKLGEMLMRIRNFSRPRAYAGIGSRETPPAILREMEALGKKLETLGYTLRSGGAKGADSAFEKEVTRKEIFLPTGHIPEWCFDRIREYVPKDRDFDRMSGYVQKLLARNMMQIWGEEGNDPVAFVVCWTKDGKDSGGTGYAIRAAQSAGIPIYNLYTVEGRAFSKSIFSMKG